MLKCEEVSGPAWSWCLVFFFFFKEPAPPRDLPSSPPRPSPELYGRRVRGVHREQVAAEDPAHHRAAPRGAGHLVEVPLGEARRRGRPRRRASPSGTSTRCPAPDRKSTRLNSSHLVISYAVFCLN